MSYLTDNQEKLGRLSGQLSALINKADSQKRGLNSAERTQFHAIETDYTALEDTVRAAKVSAAITKDLATPRGMDGLSELQTEEYRDVYRTSPKARSERMRDPHYKAFSKFLRGGMSVLDSTEAQYMSFVPHSGGSGFQAAQTSTTGSSGGYLVPQGFSDQLEDAKKWFGGIAGTVGKFTTETGNPLPWPTVNDTANKGRIIGQNVQVTETDIAFNQVTFSAYIGSSDLVLIPLALVQDSFFDMDALTARLLGTRLGRLYNNMCTIGSGSSEPTGIVTAAVAAGSTYVAPTGSTTTFAYTDLVNIEHTVDPAYRYNPATGWMFSDAVLKGLKKLVDGNGRPLWQPGLTSSFREGALVDLVAAKPLILDHPYIINQDMAVPAANANSILFGDMSTFKVREVAGGTTVMRLVERYADYLQIGFIAFQRFDSNLIDAGTHPIAVGVNSAT
jgi:HK97 family phage major capsid protein